MENRKKLALQILTETETNNRDVDNYVCPYDDVDIHTTDGLKALVTGTRTISMNYIGLLHVNGRKFDDYAKVVAFLNERDKSNGISSSMIGSLVVIGVCVVGTAVGAINASEDIKGKLISASFFLLFFAIGVLIFFLTKRDERKQKITQQAMISAMYAGRCELYSFIVTGRKYYRHVTSGDYPDDIYYYVLTDNMTFLVPDRYTYIAANDGSTLVVLTWNYEGKDRISYFIV